jgi:ABC-type uncharacterized transport system permease subunit
MRKYFLYLQLVIIKAIYFYLEALQERIKENHTILYIIKLFTCSYLTVFSNSINIFNVCDGMESLKNENTKITISADIISFNV